MTVKGNCFEGSVQYKVHHDQPKLTWPKVHKVFESDSYELHTSFIFNYYNRVSFYALTCCRWLMLPSSESCSIIKTQASYMSLKVKHIYISFI